MNKLKALASAEKYVLKGKIPAAIDNYRKAIEFDPADTTTINTLGDLYVRVGRIDAAIQSFSFLAERYFQSGFIQKAIAMLKKIEKVDPQNLEVLKKLAAIYARQGQAKEARERYLRLAELGERCGARDVVLESYQEIVHMDPTDASAHEKIGELFAMRGMSCRAMEAFLRAGEEFYRKKLWEPSLAVHTRVLAFEPQNIRALAAIARIYLHKEQPERAIELLDRALKNTPENVELIVLLGRIYLTVGNLDEAEQTLRQTLKLDKEAYKLFFELGNEYLQRGDRARAVASLDSCWELIFAWRSEERAELFLRQVLESDPHHRGALERLAKIFRRTNEEGKLLATLKTLAEAAKAEGDETAAVATLEEMVQLQTIELQQREALPDQESLTAESRPPQASGPSMRITVSMPVEKNLEIECRGLAHPTTTIQFYDHLPERLPERLHEQRGASPAKPIRRPEEIKSELFLLPDAKPQSGENQVVQQTLTDLMWSLNEQGLLTAEIRNAYEDAMDSLERLTLLSNSSTDLHMKRQLKETSTDVIEAFAALLRLSLAKGGDRPDDFHATSLPGPLGIVGSERLPFAAAAGEFLNRAPLHVASPKPLKPCTPNPANRRRVERLDMRLPVHVFSPQNRWHQYTESLDVSPLGIRFKLLNPIASGTPLRVELPLPSHLRLHESKERLYVVNAVVCHVERGENQEYLVGAEFGTVV